eukprot:jgi/Chlat1/5539/Chrsp369S00843
MAAATTAAAAVSVAGIAGVAVICVTACSQPLRAQASSRLQGTSLTARVTAVTQRRNSYGLSARRCPVRCMALPDAIEDASIPKLMDRVEEIARERPVMLFSKTYCPYCKKVKQLFQELNVPLEPLELDLSDKEEQWQKALYELTGKWTVPSVWIGGKYVGGHDDTLKLHKESQLTKLLQDAGVSFSTK